MALLQTTQRQLAGLCNQSKALWYYCLSAFFVDKYYEKKVTSMARL